MAEDYTPAMDEVALGYAERAARICGTSHFAALAEADRALAAHDAEVLRNLGLEKRPYVSAGLPGMVGGLYDADLRERSIQTVLNLAADLIETFRTVIDRADQFGEADR